jgi:hypothetical protein
MSEPLDDNPPPIPAWHSDLLRERIAAADADPGAGIPLDELRKELTGAEKTEIDRRLAAHRANPTAATPWEQVKTDALARLKSKPPERT